MNWIEPLIANVRRDGLAALGVHLRAAESAAFASLVAELGDDFRPDYAVAGVRPAGGDAIDVTVRRRHAGADVYAVRFANYGWRVGPIDVAHAVAGGLALTGLREGVDDLAALAASMRDPTAARAAFVVSGNARLPFAVWAGFAVAPARLDEVRVAEVRPGASPAAGAIRWDGFESPLVARFDAPSRRLVGLGGRDVAGFVGAWFRWR